MFAEFMTLDFWMAVGSIIMIDVLLGGDNAVVIALACRDLPAQQRKKGIILGTLGAILLRVALIGVAAQLLVLPFLKLLGGVLLVWIGAKLLMPQDDGDHDIQSSDKLWSAVRTVIVADLVMSVDNVIAITGAASSGSGHVSMPLVIFGLVVSIPLIVWGSQFVITLMERFPIIITLGGLLLGWIAGTMAISDPVLVNPEVLPSWPKLEVTAWMRYGAGVVGAVLVLLIGKLAGRARKTAV